MRKIKIFMINNIIMSCSLFSIRNYFIHFALQGYNYINILFVLFSKNSNILFIFTMYGINKRQFIHNYITSEQFNINN